MTCQKYTEFCLVLFVYWFVCCACQSNRTTFVLVSSTPPMLTTTMHSGNFLQIDKTMTSYPATANNVSKITSSVFTAATKTTPSSNGKKLESYEIIIIAACAIVIIVLLIIAFLLCFFRRKRTQRLERERNLSYNNMNYESTVRFKMDENGERSQHESDQGVSPKKKNNNRHRPGEYEEVELSKEVEKSEPRKYENVTPEKSISDNKAPGTKKAYENIKPGVATRPNEVLKSPPGQYEEVFLTSPPKDDETKKKYYENVEL